MARSVTLGGDRLGSGKKQKIQLHGYERSTHDLGYVWRSTMSAGTLVPFICEVALPGDTFDINLACDVKTHPTVGPLFGSYKVQLDVFEAPIRLYQGDLHNNKLGIGMKMANVLLPQIRLTAETVDPDTNPDIDNAQINPSCLLAYLGIRGVALVTTPETPKIQRLFNGVPLLAYWDTYKNYYSNKQEEIGAVVYPDIQSLQANVTSAQITHIGDTPINYPQNTGPNSIDLREQTIIDFQYTSPAIIIPSQLLIVTDSNQFIPFSDIVTGLNDTGAAWRGTYNFAKYGHQSTVFWVYIDAAQIPSIPPKVRTFNLNNIDTMREKILQVAGTAPAFIVNDALLPGAVQIEPYNLLLEPQAGTLQYLGSQSGLAIKTYQSDLFNNWIKTEWIDGTGGITEITSIDTTAGFFTLDTLNLSKKVYDMLNRIATSGGTYDDWQIAVYDHEPIQRAETPMYHGGLIKELIFQEVVSNSESQGPNGSQPLGTLAGKGAMAQKHKGGSMTIRINELGYILGIVSLTPRIDYSQGNMWDTHLKTMDDFHKPALDEIGFQELITEQMAWWDTKWLIGTTFLTKSAGKQPAWINYMTNVNRVYGNFAIQDNEMFMTLNRRYEALYDSGANTIKIKDLTTYIDPTKYNNIFAETSLDAQNFWVQIAVDITARRKMSARIMPNL